MILTKEQQAILDGEQGETLAKVMKTLVMYGDAFEAEKLVPMTSSYNHLVTSFGLKVMSPVYDLMQKLLDAGVSSGKKFSVEPRPLDKNVPANFLQNLVFNKFMYTKQDFYEAQLEKLGLMDKNAFTCTCYMDEVGNKPKCGDQSNKPLINKALCLPQTIGSTTGGLVLYCACSMGKNPACMLFANHIDSLGDEFLSYVKDGMKITVKPDGIVEVEE